MVKWCNESGEMVQRIHTSLHCEMVKHTSGDILFAKCKNSETVILAFVIPLFQAPLQQWGPILLLESIRCCFWHIISGWCYVYRLIIPWGALTPFDAVSSRFFWLIHFFFAFFPPPPTPGGLVPFCNLFIITIVCVSYTGNILYYLCVTVRYTTFTSAIWSPHDLFVKFYLYTHVEVVPCLHTILGLKSESVTRSLIYKWFTSKIYIVYSNQ